MALGRKNNSTEKATKAASQHHSILSKISSSDITNTKPKPSITTPFPPFSSISSSLSVKKSKVGLSKQKKESHKKKEWKNKIIERSLNMTSTISNHHSNRQKQFSILNLQNLKETLQMIQNEQLEMENEVKKKDESNINNYQKQSPQKRISSSIPSSKKSNSPSYSFIKDKPTKSIRSRKNLIQSESLQFQQVLSHPSFMSNPLQTIQTHLKNVIETL